MAIHTWVNNQTNAKIAQEVANALSQMNNFGKLCHEIGAPTTTSQLYALYCIETSSNSNAEKQELKDFLLETTLLDPCTGDEIDKDPIMAQVCAGTSGVTMAAVNDVLDGVDIIYFDPTMTPFMKCIYKNFLKSNGNIVCLELKKFNGKAFDLQFGVADIEGANGMTKYDPKLVKNKIFIDFNSTYVSNSCDVLIMKTMIHETIHASIIAAITKMSDLDLAIYYPGLEEYIDLYGDEQGEHEYMAKFLRDKIKDALQEIYGNNYSDAEYETMVWSGLHDTFQFKSIAFPTDEDKEAFNLNFNKVKDKCKDILCKK